MNLFPFIAKGFPGALDTAIATVSVRGVDREQAQGMIRLCEETENTLYGDYSPRYIRYQRGTRPQLERITAGFLGTTTLEKATEAMQWVYAHIMHPHQCGPTAPDRALSEEDLIASGRGWCNEQVRVFIALCEVMAIPARICYIHHLNARCAHTTAEVFIQGRWSFFDVTFNLVVELPDGRLAEVRELSKQYRNLANLAYAPVLERHYQNIQSFTEENPGWCRADRPEVDKGGDLLESIGISNYIIDGVQTI